MASSAALTTTHLPRIRDLLKEWERKQPPTKGFATPTDTKDRDNGQRTSAKDVIVAFRTRPPLENEAADKFKGSLVKDHQPTGSMTEEIEGSNEINVDFCPGISIPSVEPGIFIAHVPGMKWSGPTLAHKSYDADLAFGPDVNNEEVYQRIVTASDLLPFVLSGGIGCILAYGQTGSGKTFTMEGLEHRIARDIFESGKVVGKRLLESVTGRTDEDGSSVFEFTVTFLELLGRYASDLVEPSSEVDEQGNFMRKKISIREDKVGDVLPALVTTTISTAAELENLITKTLSHRRTSDTLRNATSSRSHALLTIHVKNRLIPYARPGQLILVDLAGSERHEDSKAHDKARMDEAKDNNQSLMNLKECVKAKAKMDQEDGFVHIPWRSSKLTMLLKPIFDIESWQPTKTIIIAHVSPHIQDTTHSTNTLSYASPFKTTHPKPRGPAPHDDDDPRTWSHEYTLAWLTKSFQDRQSDNSTLALGFKNVQLSENEQGAGNEKIPVNLPVDMTVLCPPGRTAMNFGQMHAIEFVEECIKAIPKSDDQTIKDNLTDELKKVAVEIIGQLFYLILTAKTKSRNDIMNSRKKMDLDGVYGEEAIIYHPITGAVYTPVDYDHTELVDARSDIPQAVWDKTIDDAVQKAKEEGTWQKEAWENAVQGMMEHWRATKLKQAADVDK